jgi:inosine-uridine nucleoside N-ribohydrolase
MLSRTDGSAIVPKRPLSLTHSPTRLIIDTDPGVDDALAILFALASPELEVVGITTVFGNADVATTTRNAFAILDAAGRPDIPVARGAADPIAGPYAGGVPHIHGFDGLGDAGVSSTARDAIASVPAAEFIWQTASAMPGQLTIVALGPLTNLALALRLRPELPGLVAQVIVMGGNALVPGNATPCAEANVHNDPEAADLVFGAEWPVTMVGLDVTQKAILTGSAIERITALRTPSNALLAGAIPLYQKFCEQTNDIDGIFLHDPSALAYLVAPSLFQVERWPIRVERHGIGRGKTWPGVGDTDDPAPAAWAGRPLVQVSTGVLGDQVAALVASRLTGETSA